MDNTTFTKVYFWIFETDLNKNDIKLLLYLKMATQDGRFKNYYIEGEKIMQEAKLTRPALTNSRKRLVEQGFIKYEDKRYTVLKYEPKEKTSEEIEYNFARINSINKKYEFFFNGEPEGNVKKTIYLFMKNSLENFEINKEAKRKAEEIVKLFEK